MFFRQSEVINNITGSKESFSRISVMFAICCHVQTENFEAHFIVMKSNETTRGHSHVTKLSWNVSVVAVVTILVAVCNTK